MSAIRSSVGNLSVLALALAFAPAATAQVNWESLPYTRHADLQAVNSNGSPAYAGGFPLRVRGVLLNAPGSVFSDAPSFIPVDWPRTAFQFGGRQQPYVQAVDLNDSGGTAMFLAQCLGNHPVNQDDAFSYTNEQWTAEVFRLTRDAATGHVFQPGDLVEVRARAGLHFSGKFNINEAHSNNPSNDYDVVLLQAGFGLPRPLSVKLSDVKSPANLDIFDPARTAGGERFQSQLVLLRNVTIAPGSDWRREGLITLTDGVRTIPAILGTSPSFDTAPAPTGTLDILGIFDQEASPSPIGGLNGYRLIALDVPSFRPACPADFNADAQADFFDFLDFAAAFAAVDPSADFNSDGQVDFFDYLDYAQAFASPC
ncbi:MAG: hypothetical protein SFZ23_15350 [Planctomycetota bacterium]|nr:hypothetical protein [Planctomycetota bacterium]